MNRNEAGSFPEWLRASSQETTIKVSVQPGAKKSCLNGEINGMLRLRIAAPPVDGAANKEVVRFMADLLGLRKNQVGVKKGQLSRQKVLAVSSLSPGDIWDVLRRLLDSPESEN